MKNIKYSALMLVVLITASSCKKFLTVNPKTEMKRDELFSNESGFKDALVGVYIQMKADQSYGKAMTMTTVEQLVSSWDVLSNTPAQRLGLYDYGSADGETAMAELFKQQYSVIAGINAILMQIDGKKDIFNPGMYEMIKGECLALRAYCHFDLLRLFGPVPGATGVGNRLSYVTTISKTPNPAIDYEAYKVALLKDLSDAEVLEKNVDPFTLYSIMDFKRGTFKPSDDFVNHRYLRMNYYAVKALQARAYLWFKDSENAYLCAKVLIDVKNKEGDAKFRLGNSSDMANKDFVLTCEHIFGLYDYRLYTKYNNTFANMTLKKGGAETTIKNQLYGSTGTDIREANLWELLTLNSLKSYVCKKYQVVESPANLLADFKQIPMLRISEMYLIAIETAADAEAQSLWNTFRAARNLNPAVLSVNPDQRKLDIIKEYRKEFYAEGQAFFAYKRVNAVKANVLFTPAAATINYLPPLPKIETTTTN